MAGGNDDAVWLYGEDNNSDAWGMCEPDDSKTLENYFQRMHLIDTGDKELKVNLQNSFGTYEVDLTAMTQTNKASGRTRPLQRLGPSIEEMKAARRAGAKPEADRRPAATAKPVPAAAAAAAAVAAPAPAPAVAAPKSVSSSSSSPSSLPSGGGSGGGSKDDKASATASTSTCPGGKSPPQTMFVRLRDMSMADFETNIGGGGVDLDAEFEASGGTLLTWAAEYHRADMVEVLLARRADKEKKSSMEQMTPLEWATRTPALRGKEAQRDATIAALS
jgi:hypothetical protein